MNKDIIEQLKKVREHNGQVNPDRVWVVENKKRIIAQISNTIDANSQKFSFSQVWQAISIFVPADFTYKFVRPAFTILLIGVIATSGWITSVGASINCLPGEACYSVKLATEKTQEVVVSVTGSKADKTQLKLEFASRRVNEVKKVVEKNDTKAVENAVTAIKNLQKNIESAKKDIQEVSKVEPTIAVAMTKDLSDKTGEIVNTLKEVEKQTQNTDSNLVKEVVETKKVVNDASLTAIEAVIQSSSDTTVQNEARQLVQQQIDVVITENETAKTANQLVKNTVEALPTIATSSPQLNIGSSTLPIVSSTIKEIVAEVVKKTDETTQAVTQNMEAAKTLVQSNQLLEAVQKLKNSNEATTEAQKAAADAKTAISTTLTAPAPVQTPVQPTIIPTTTPVAPQAVTQPAVTPAPTTNVILPVAPTVKQ